jgi:hypothetical protein
MRDSVGRFRRGFRLLKPKVCPNCEEAFQPREAQQVFCSMECSREGQEHTGGRDDYYAATWPEIAAAVGVSRTRAQQLFASAIEKLRKHLDRKEVA